MKYIKYAIQGKDGKWTGFLQMAWEKGEHGDQYRDGYSYADLYGDAIAYQDQDTYGYRCADQGGIGKHQEEFGRLCLLDNRAGDLRCIGLLCPASR